MQFNWLESENWPVSTRLSDAIVKQRPLLTHTHSQSSNVFGAISGKVSSEKHCQLTSFYFSFSVTLWEFYTGDKPQIPHPFPQFRSTKRRSGVQLLCPPTVDFLWSARCRSRATRFGRRKTSTASTNTWDLRHFATDNFIFDGNSTGQRNQR